MHAFENNIYLHYLIQYYYLYKVDSYIIFSYLCCMSDDAEILLEILHDILGDEKLHYKSKGQISFDCPICDEDQHKGNLEVNYFEHKEKTANRCSRVYDYFTWNALS